MPLFFVCFVDFFCNGVARVDVLRVHSIHSARATSSLHIFMFHVFSAAGRCHSDENFEGVLSRVYRYTLGVPGYLPEYDWQYPGTYPSMAGGTRIPTRV